MQEETIQFLTEYRKYRVLWWGFGPTLLEDLCREQEFDVTEFLAKRDKYQCAELLMAFGDRKKYWWLPWSKKITDTTFDEKACRRAFEYHQYSWFWQVILGLFTPVLLHRQVLKWINIEYGGYMYRSNNQKIAKSYLTIAADFNTVGGTLKSLGFSEPLEEGQEEVPLLQRLDDSLERVRRNMETAEQHREFVAKIDREIKKSSLKIHSDKVNAGDDKQAALNACRSIIKNASEFFLEYIHIDFKYECYNKMKISSLGTMNSLNTGFLTRLSQISRTKQEEIITPTHKFLKASRSSLAQFITSRSCEGRSSDQAQYMFEQYRNDALNYLTSCIAGCEKFNNRCEEVQEECRQDAELRDLLYDSIFDMSYKNNKQLEQLCKLKEFAGNALQGEIGIIGMREMDEYMVLPFAMYVGALALCSNASNDKKVQIGYVWWMLEKMLSLLFRMPAFDTPSSISILLFSSFFPVSMNIGKQSENFNEVLTNLASYLNVRKEINIYQFVNAIEIISNKLAEACDPDNYRPLTVEFYLEESRELARRIDAFTKQVAEDLAHARRILQDQEKIREGFAEVRNNQAELRKRMQDFEANLDELLVVFTQPQPSSSLPAQNPQPQPQPSGSLIDVEPERHSQSMSKD